MVPNPRKIFHQIGNGLLFQRTQTALFLFLLLLGLLLDLAVLLQTCIPLRFQDRGHQPILWINAQKAPLGQFGSIAGPFDLLIPQVLCRLDLGMQFFIDLQSGVNRERGHLSEQQISNGRIEPCAQNMLAGLLCCLLYALFLAHVFRNEMRCLLGLMIADGHAIATLSTDDQSLQQGWPFSRRAMTAIPSERLTVLTQLLAIGFIVVPADVAHMGVLEEKWPFFLGDGLDAEPAIQPFTAVGPSVAERPSIARIPHDLEHGIVDERCPMNGSCMGASTDTARKEQSLFAKIFDRCPG